jgi:hypothetical protein
VVLRNFKNINLDYILKNGGDVDLLADDKSNILYILGDLSFVDKEDEQVKIDIAKHQVLFDVSQTRENLFDKDFEKNIFLNKERSKNMFHLSAVENFYALIYHALLCKERFEDKHFDRIKSEISTFKDIKVIYALSDIEQIEDFKNKLLNLLYTYFKNNNYKFIKPDDHRIHFSCPDYYDDIYVKNKNRKSKLMAFVFKLISFEVKKRDIRVVIFRPIKNKINVTFNIKYIVNFSMHVGLRK